MFKYYTGRLCLLLMLGLLPVVHMSPLSPRSVPLFRTRKHSTDDALVFQHRRSLQRIYAVARVFYLASLPCSFLYLAFLFGFDHRMRRRPG
jgi:UDP-N-acetylmuramyl pentapeptide phosphotransferase/UDP-N-acetylglucosamine-1-phosphate transferase